MANFSLATGVLAFTPDNAWLFLSVFRLIIGFGAGGLYCVDIPLVQEFVPASKRGMVGGLVTASVPVGILLGAVLGATATPYVGWRRLFAIETIPGLLTLLIRAWVPESPRWLIQMGRMEEARKSLAWALEMDPADLPVSPPQEQKLPVSRLSDIFRYPRSLAVSWITNLGAQTGYNGFHPVWSNRQCSPSSLQIHGMNPCFETVLAGALRLFPRNSISEYFPSCAAIRLNGPRAHFGSETGVQRKPTEMVRL